MMGQMEARLHAIDPLYKGGSSFGIGDLNSTNKVFLWTGLQWNEIILLSRAMWAGIAGANRLGGVQYYLIDLIHRGHGRASSRKGASPSKPQKPVERTFSRVSFRGFSQYGRVSGSTTALWF